MPEFRLFAGLGIGSFTGLHAQLAGTPLEALAAALGERSQARFREASHGDLPRWLVVLEALPVLPADRVVLDAPWIEVASVPAAAPEVRQQLAGLLHRLHPWRKGPYRIHGLELDAEWRSDLKWDRLTGAIAPLEDRLVLDVGCGNGYHVWRMAGAGARAVVGIDPTLLYAAQFYAVRHFLGEHRVAVLPLALEDLPEPLPAFDTVFSMGVLYHRRSPLDHLLDLQRWLRPGGELVLETLVLAGGQNEVLVPPARYAQMKNVWFIPTPATLVGWLRRCGYRDVRVIDVTLTTPEEQRSTDWMGFQSLQDFLDPDDPGKTVEGFPAPRRGILIARR